jgi:hypothetical protein
MSRLRDCRAFELHEIAFAFAGPRCGCGTSLGTPRQGTHVKYGGYSKNSGNSKLLDMVVLHTRGRNASRGPRRASSYDGWAKNYSEKLRCLHLVPSYFLPRRAAMSWRDTLFVWRGPFSRVTARPENNKNNPAVTWQWEGTWIGLDAGGKDCAKAPAVADFANNALPKFRAIAYVTPPAPMSSGPASVSPQNASGSSGDCVGGFDRVYSFVGGDHTRRTLEEMQWQLDQGDGNGLAWLGDDYIDIAVENDLVVAVGGNAFGPFVAAGYVSGYRYRVEQPCQVFRIANTTETRDVTLARRYLDTKDLRASWTLDTLKREIRSGMINGTHAWNAPAMAAATMKKCSVVKRKR